MADGIIRKDIKGGYVVAKFVATGFLKTNHSNARIGANSAGETVSSMNICSVAYSTANGAYYTVARGANTVLVLGGNGPIMDFQSAGFYPDSDAGEPTSNCVVTKVGLGPTFLEIKFHKRVSITGGSQY